MDDLREEVDDTIVRSLLVNETSEPRDALPYTEEFDGLHDKYCRETGKSVSKYSLMKAFFRVGKKGGISGRRASVSAPEIDQAMEIYIGRIAGHNLGARASMVYTIEFDRLHRLYVSKFELVNKSTFWLLLDRMAKRARGDDWRTQLRKAKEAACLAVELYNKPLTTFRTQGFVAMMVIAWTSLFHAFFYRLGIVPKYPRRENENEDHYWDLRKSLKEFFKDETSPMKANLDLFIGLRHEIEHRSLPQIDHRLFGHSQAMVMNFEDLLVAQFGESESLSDHLALAVQFSRARSAEQCEAMRRQLEPLPSDIEKFLDEFKEQLSTDITDSMEYCYKVFVIPKLANRESQSDIAIEFVPFDSRLESDRDRVSKLTTLLKERQVAVANKDNLKPSDVCRKVNAALDEKGIGMKFVPSYHHAAAVEFYGIKPPRDSNRPERTNTKYCLYDEPYGTYVYTPAWVEFLIEELQKEGQYEEILEARRA